MLQHGREADGRSMKTLAASIEELNDILAAAPFIKPYGFTVKHLFQANARSLFLSCVHSSLTEYGRRRQE